MERRERDKPSDGEERFFWGGKGSTQPYTETYDATSGSWHRDL